MDTQEIFKQYVVRAVQVVLQHTEKDSHPTLREQTRRRALHVLDEYALKLPESWTGTRQLLLALAPRLEQAGYRERWIATMTNGLRLSRDQNDWPVHAELSLRIGQLYRLMSRFTEAETHLLSSVQSFAELGDTTKQAQALNQLAYLACFRHQYDHSEQLTKQALALVNDQSLTTAMSFSALGLVAHFRRQYTTAIAYHEQALQIRTTHNAHREIAWSLQNLGNTLRSQGELAAAAKNFEKALILLTEVEDHAHKAIVQMNLGANYDAQGNAAQGLQLLEEAEPILRSLSDEMNLAKLLTNKGLCYLTLQFYEQAEIAFAQSAGLFEALNDLSWYLNARDGLGITYLERNWFDRALQIFESVAARLDEIKGTPAHGFLSTTLVKQLEQARSKNVNRGSSVYKVDPKR